MLATVATLEERLENWGSCLRQRRKAHETPSKESSYRCPQGSHWTLPGAPGAPGTPQDMRDALVIDGAVSALPLNYHAVLRAFYVGQGRMHMMVRWARKIGFHGAGPREVDAMLDQARALLAAKLLEPACERKERARARVQQEIGGMA